MYLLTYLLTYLLVTDIPDVTDVTLNYAKILQSLFISTILYLHNISYLLITPIEQF